MQNIDNINWHDLPLDQISINSDSIELKITPFNESTKEYDSYVFKLHSFSDLSISIESKLDVSDLGDMEISTFKFSKNNDLLTGEIGILPANSGYWSIAFKNAQWSICANI